MVNIGLQFFAEPVRLFLSSPEQDGDNLLFLNSGSSTTLVWSVENDDGTITHNVPIGIFGGNAPNELQITNYGRYVTVPSTITSGSYTLQAYPIINGIPYDSVITSLVFYVIPSVRYSRFARTYPTEGEVISSSKGNSVTVEYFAYDDVDGIPVNNIELDVISVFPKSVFTFSNYNRTITINENAEVGSYQITFAPRGYTEPTATTIINVTDVSIIPVDFYITGRPSQINMTRGESRTLDFNLALSNGSITVPENYVWTTVTGITASKNVLTVSNSVEYGSYRLSVYPVYDGNSYNDLAISIDVVVASQEEFTITLYRNSSEQARIDKTNYLESVGVLSGTLRESTSIVSPVITIQLSTVPNFNYVLISKFSRYYYVVDIVSVRTGLWEITLMVDPLMSFKNAILNCRAFIDRNEFEQSPNIVDTRRVVEEGYAIYETEIPNSLFNDTAMFALSGFYCTTGGEAT